MIKNILSDYGIYDSDGNIIEKTVRIKNRLQFEIYSSICKHNNIFEYKDINWYLEYVEVSYHSGEI